MSALLQTALVNGQDQWFGEVGTADRNKIPGRDLRRIIDEYVGDFVYPVVSQ